MKYRILLVDDERVFLQSLQEGMTPLNSSIQTDIAYSVDEARDMVLKHRYDLIVTDVRMPDKSGIDLMIFLKEIQFKGTVMAMSAYNTQDSMTRMRSLGVIDVLSKPFELAHFRGLIQSSLNEEPVNQMTTIGLISVLQIINLDQKSVIVQLDHHDQLGSVFFNKGEIVHAEFDGFSGEEALMRMIPIGESSLISVRPMSQKRIKRTITRNFMDQMMELMRLIDELNIPPAVAQSNPIEETTKEVMMSVPEILKEAKDVNGYLGIGVFTPQGELLEGEADASGIHFETAGAQIHDMLLHAQEMAVKSGFGRADTIQVDTEGGLVFAKCYNDGKSIHFHTVLILKRDGNVAMGKLKLKKIVEALVLEM